MGIDSFPGKSNSLQRQEAAIVPEIEKFKQFIQTVVFSDLGIAEADEHHSRMEPLPEGTPDVLREARERSFGNIREMTKSFFIYFKEKGKVPGNLLADLRNRVESIRENAFIGFNNNAGNISEILKDGEIRPTFHLSPEQQNRSATGRLYSQDAQMRLRVETALGFNEREHPAYLALGSDRNREHGPAPHYGAFHFSFPLEKLRQRTICVAGDSLNRWGVPYSLRDEQFRREAASVEEQAQKRELTLEHGLLAKALFELDDEYEPKHGGEANFTKAVNYVEVLVLDPVHVSDAGELVLSRREAARPSEIKALTTKFPSATRLTEAINELQPNLTFHIVGEPPADIEKYASYTVYERFFRK